MPLHNVEEATEIIIGFSMEEAPENRVRHIHILALDSLLSGRESEELRQIVVTKDEVLNLIDILNASKSPGPDDTNPRVLKELKYEIAQI